MSEQTEFDPLLTEDELFILNQLREVEAPYSQRAQALLALHAGESEETAASLSGLRPTQVHYWQNKYRKSRLAVFPEALLAEVVDKEAGEEIPEPETASPVVEETEIVVTETAVVEAQTDAPPPTAKKEKKKKAKDKKKKGKGKKSKKADGKKKKGKKDTKKKGKKDTKKKKNKAKKKK